MKLLPIHKPNSDEIITYSQIDDCDWPWANRSKWVFKAAIMFHGEEVLTNEKLEVLK